MNPEKLAAHLGPFSFKLNVIKQRRRSRNTIFEMQILIGDKLYVAINPPKILV